MTLPYDYARCAGTTYAACQNCQRREPGRAEWQSYIAAPIALDGTCSHQIPYEVRAAASTAKEPT